MIRLLRHGDTVHREDARAVCFDDLADKFKAKFGGISQWTIEACKRRRTEEEVSVLL